MQEIIQWLRQIEHLANELYLKAADVFSDDPILKDFLAHIGEEEAWHYHAMGSAADLLSRRPFPTPVISVDENTGNKISQYLKEISDGLENGTVSRTELIKKIVRLELSEWNDIFLYVVNVLQEHASEFKYPAARMQLHIKEIEYFLEHVESRPELLEELKTLPSIWVENILIVDDEPVITDLLKALFYHQGNIDIAHDGEEALGLIHKKYYKLVISDIDMPRKDGFTFFDEAVSKFPELRKRFLFITGDLTHERKSFCDRNGVACLSKPTGIDALRKAASRIILST